MAAIENRIVMGKPRQQTHQQRVTAIANLYCLRRGPYCGRSFLVYLSRRSNPYLRFGGRLVAGLLFDPLGLISNVLESCSDLRRRGHHRSFWGLPYAPR